MRAHSDCACPCHTSDVHHTFACCEGEYWAIRLLTEIVGDRLKFGLRAQGHWNRVMFMMAMGATWGEIGSAIGWSADAVERFVEMEASEVTRKRAAKRKT